MKFSGLSSLLSKVLESNQTGMLKRILTGAGLTFGSTLTVTAVVDNYVNRLVNDVHSLPADMLMLMGLSRIDYGLSVVLSAVVARSMMNASGVFLKKR